MKQFLVTGGAGFIGSHIVDYLLSQNYSVTILDNFVSGTKSNLAFLERYPSSQYTLIEGDLQDKKACESATKNCDIILHHAALGSVPESINNPMAYEANNVQGTLNLLLAARNNHVSKVIQASSSAIYGDEPSLPKNESMVPTPKSPYALSKLTCEHYGAIFTSTFNLPVMSLRYFNVFGPRQNPNSQYAAVIPKFVTSYLSNTPPTIYGDGNQTRDFIHINTIIQANMKGCNAPESAFGKAYNIGNQTEISINTLSAKIATLLDSPLSPTHKDARSGDIKHSYGDITLAKRELNFLPSTDFDAELKSTIDWFKRVSPQVK